MALNWSCTLDISLSTATMENVKELPDEESRISNAIFSIGLKISKLLSFATEAPTCAAPVRQGLCLPKSVFPHLMDTYCNDNCFVNSLSYAYRYIAGPNYPRDALKGGPPVVGP